MPVPSRLTVTEISVSAGFRDRNIRLGGFTRDGSAAHDGLTKLMALQ
ncbi:hypothetical protein EIO_2326 [Ketogulonicigenium vulgare Y25]|nr:hypothetical protein EIO_2326 [Ketogulonicigenium vulgare Y25]